MLLDDPFARSYLSIHLNTGSAMPADALDMTFKALADPTRRAILARLALGETSVQELAKPFDMSLPAVSQHLKVLETAGLVTRGRTAQWRPCRLEPKALKEATEWLDQYRRFWEESFGKLDLYLKDIQSKETDT
jgi:DNA-binding transcriptional ArsR family regulator